MVSSSLGCDISVLNVRSRVNPHTVVVLNSLNGYPRPKIYKLEALDPPGEISITTKLVMLLIRAFKECASSTTFLAQYAEMWPLIQYVKITHKPTNVNTFIAVKTGHCKLVADPLTGKKVMWRLWADETYRVFTWQFDWDYLLTLVDSGENDQEQPTAILDAKRAYFLPRDEIPERWWNAEKPDTGGTGEHPGGS